jgi:hypothetical protein
LGGLLSSFHLSNKAFYYKAAVMNDQHEQVPDGKAERQEESLPPDPTADPEEIRVVLNTLNSFLYVRTPIPLHVKVLLTFVSSFYISHMLTRFIVPTAACPTTT